MRTFLRRRAFGATLLAVALVTAACGGSGGGAQDRPTITVASFNFSESVILAEIYAQALEAKGYPVARKLNLGSRELIFPEIKAGHIDLLPEYVNSSLVVGFGKSDVPTDLNAAVAELSTSFAGIGMDVLQPAPGQDTNVFVVTGALAQEKGLKTLEDLAGAGELTLGGPPECENRDTCYQGLVKTYGLSNLKFSSIQEGAARIAALENGEIQVALLFSTQPVIKQKGFVALQDSKHMIAPENIIPVVSKKVADAYGTDLTSLLNGISAKITTDVLLTLNGQVELDAQDPATVAKEWLAANG